MLVELLVVSTVSYISGRVLCTTAESVLAYAETHKRNSTHKFAGKLFSVNTNQEYRDLMQGVAAVNQMVQCVKNELSLNTTVENCYRICLVEGIIEWGQGGDASYTSLVANLPPEHREQYICATKKSWESLNSNQVGAMFCLAHFFVSG